ncbi:MAG: histidine phosphatase family protein [Marmoricola sp.]
MSTPRLLVVMRHAKSDWSGGEPDRLRGLADRGRRQAAEAGLWFAVNTPDLDVALVSPARRAHDTWELACFGLIPPPPVRVVEEVYAATGEELLEVVEGLDEDVRRAVLVGHNPGLEELVELLTGRSVTLKTSSIAVVDLDGRRLLALGRPPPATMR